MAQSAWHSNYVEAEEVLKLKDAQLTEADKKLMETKAKLKVQQTLYESVRADRNLSRKQHIESQDEIAEVRRTKRDRKLEEGETERGKKKWRSQCLLYESVHPDRNLSY